MEAEAASPTTTDGEHGKGENGVSWKTKTKFHARAPNPQPTTCTNAEIKEDRGELETTAATQSEPTTANWKAGILWQSAANDTSLGRVL